MKRKGFVRAVTAAINQGHDCWEAEYYRQNKWKPTAGTVYMETRISALGPEWRELQRCVGMMKRHIPRA